MHRMGILARGVYLQVVLLEDVMLPLRCFAEGDRFLPKFALTSEGTVRLRTTTHNHYVAWQGNNSIAKN